MLDFCERNVLTGNVSIKNRLVPHVTAFNDDVVDRSRKARITEKGQDEVVDIFSIMGRFHGYDFKTLESF
jgi:hypothetical protein